MAQLQILKPRIAMAVGKVVMADQSPRIRGRKWMEIRDRIFKRDCGLCQECKKHGRIKAASQVDHTIALTNGGTNDDDNLAAICDDCHDTKTNADLGYKPRVTIGLDGWPVEQERSTGPAWKRKGYR